MISRTDPMIFDPDCHYELHTKRAWKKWWRRQLARVVVGEMGK